ncbi:Transcriptional activator TraM [compost metagenome]
MQDSCARTTAILRAEMDAALERIAATLQDAQRVARLNVLAACLALATAAMAFWALWR